MFRGKMLVAALIGASLVFGTANQAQAKPIPLNKKVEQRIEKELKKVAQGNEGDADVEGSFDPKTGWVKGSGWILHRHKIGSHPSIHRDGLKVKVRHVPLYAYSVKNEFSFKYNVVTGEGDAKLDLGRGVKVKLSELFGFLAD